ncbi:uncharacterized protein BJX67DRAFT_343744 [Aspergillus lucknowensis]|uniref:Erythromycin esterase n=1 Tax=Aspergillus lucknowensis TaxID=176173 RepID=A0ABR4M3I9_9EURO
MPVRRSARLRSLVEVDENTPAESSKNQNNVNNNTNSHNNLDPVMEHEEPRAPESPNIRRTPAATVQMRTPKKTHTQKKSPEKTPTTSITRPTHNEMHPSKVHQSTTKQADSGLILGFGPLKKDAQGNVVKDTPIQNTPSKMNASPASAYYGTPAFDFKFSSQESQLSDEAKKLMESLREDVARCKAKMIKENASAASAAPHSERKIAKPKGKAGRFSDIHMAEFKKMDSIAGHASAFRATPGRFQPVEKTLKRTNSKARLDEPESHTAPAEASPKAQTPTTPSAKRVRHDKPSLTSTSRLVTPRLAIARPRTGVRSSLLTPTRASIARASASLKPTRTTKIPSLARSPLSKQAEAPTTPRTEFNPRFKSSIPTLSNLKSILRRREPLFSKDPSKIAAGTHQAAPDFTPDLLLQPSRESSHEPAATPSPKKRVEFTPNSKARQAEEVVSPSPSKAPATASTIPSTSDVIYPTLPTLTPERSSAQTFTTIRPVRPSDFAMEAALPEIPGMPHGLSHKKRHRAADDEADRENVPPADSVSQERSAKRVKISSPAPSKVIASSPLKARSHTPLRSGSRASRTGTPASGRPQGRMLSVSRLNMLAQPKHRP